MNLAGKVAVVTGAGSGIGKSSAIAFAKAGAKVGVLSHTADEVNAVVAEINAAQPGQAIPLVVDITDVEGLKKAYTQTVEKFGKLDILFANAGLNGRHAPVEELEDEEWHKTIHTNLTGTFYTIKYAVPHLKKNGSGNVLITSSINGTRVFSNSGATAYATSKAGQIAIGKMLALELARFKIRVNMICPGAIDTEINDTTRPKNVDKIKIKADYEEPHPLAGGPGSPDQVAQLALFLASDASSHITGTPVWIDGAESLLRG